MCVFQCVLQPFASPPTWVRQSGAPTSVFVLDWKKNWILGEWRSNYQREFIIKER